MKSGKKDNSYFMGNATGQFGTVCNFHKKWYGKTTFQLSSQFNHFKALGSSWVSTK